MMTSPHNLRNFKKKLFSNYEYEMKKNEEYKRLTIMSELLISYPDLLDNFIRRHSKTPCRLKIKAPFFSNNNLLFLNPKVYSPKTYTKFCPKLGTKNIKQSKNQRNFREMNTSPLMKHIQGGSKSINIIKNKNKNKKKNSSEPKKGKNIVLSRSISFSILDNNKKNSTIENNKPDKYLNKSQENKENNSINLIGNNKDSSKNSNKKKVNKKIYKIESLSQVGYSGPGVVKYNQDNFFIYKNLNDENNVLFIGVCDGHGLVGHDVSKYLINNLPKNLNKELKKTNKYISHKETLYSTMKQVFINTNKDLCKNPVIDTQFSGSTCVTIILTKNKIITANAGDSRAVLGRCVNGEWKSIDLSHDQKPNNPGERERILSHGGRIEAYKDENGGDFGPPRVWLKFEDVPGLAMSRSFGDEVAASVGTISEPEIETYEISEDDKFIILASDGIWEFISSQECVNFIKDFYVKKDLKGCLKFLLNESSKRWIKEEEVIDDITAVLIFFEE